MLLNIYWWKSVYTWEKNEPLVLSNKQHPKYYLDRMGLLALKNTEKTIQTQNEI